MKKALAIDVGGTKIYNTIVNEKGEITGDIEKRPTPKSFQAIKKAFEEIDELRAQANSERDKRIFVFAFNLGVRLIMESIK